MSALQAFLICKPPITSHPTRLHNHILRPFHFAFSFSSSTRYPSAFNVASSSSNSHPLSEPEAQVSHFPDASNEVDGEVNAEPGKFSFFVFLLGFFARFKAGLEKMLFRWWPFWRQEKRLELLISEADLNPKDPAKQTALLVELNKHRFLGVLFEVIIATQKIITTG